MGAFAVHGRVLKIVLVSALWMLVALSCHVIVPLPAAGVFILFLLLF